jgi:MFS family permease
MIKEIDMQLNKNQKSLINKVIEGWENADLIDVDTANKLKAFDTVQEMDWAKLSKYSFWLAIASIIIAIGTLFADKWIISLITYIFEAPKIVLSILFAILSAVTFFLGWKFEKKNPQKSFSITFIQLLGAVFLSFSFIYLLQIFDKNQFEITSILALSTLSYALLGYQFRSIPLWVLALFSLVACYISFTDEWTRSGNYFLGMNFPLRITVLAALLYAATFFLKRIKVLQDFVPSSQLFSLLLLFFFLWILSISGNVPNVDHWEKTQQFSRIFWGIFAMAICLFAIYRGFTMQNIKLQLIGFLFFLLNMYTRYFEYFWNSLHKALFFAILGVSFWFIGTKAEKYWRQKIKPLEQVE